LRIVTAAHRVKVAAKMEDKQSTGSGGDGNGGSSISSGGMMATLQHCHSSMQSESSSRKKVTINQR